MLPLCARVAAISLSAEILSALQSAGLERTRSYGAHLNSETADGLQQSLCLSGGAASFMICFMDTSRDAGAAWFATGHLHLLNNIRFTSLKRGCSLCVPCF